MTVRAPAPGRTPQAVQTTAADAETRGIRARAHECGRYIWARTPHVRMIAVSGSLTRPEHDGPHDDADFFVIARRGGVWQGFFGCLLHGWLFARRQGLPRTFFCFNYLVDEAYPEEIDLSRREYVVEFLRLDPVEGHDVYLDLLERLRPRLEACEPELFRRAVDRATGQSQKKRASAKQRGPAAWMWGALYTVFQLPFLMLAKRMEARRRKAYPGGHVYSSRRAIRSHFRRNWSSAGIEHDALPASQAFTNIADAYDRTFTESPANRHMRSVVWQTLTPMIGQGTTVLDLGCGTGVDAEWMARRGASVLAIDVAAGMVAATNRRIEAEGLGDRVTVRRLAIEELSDLLPEYARRFNVILANFGSLNMADDPESWGPVIARLLKVDGRLVATVMNRTSVWELMAGLGRFRPSYALRRLRGEPLRVGGARLKARLHSPSGFARRVKRALRVERTVGLCVIAPPPDLERFGQLIPGQWRLLSWLDRVLGAFPGLRAAGDHFLVMAGPANGVRFDRRGLRAVTASPVVVDANGDGRPEIIVADDRLHVLDSRGRSLPGWPRRLGGPLASTPAVERDGDTVTVYVGSDDDRLYATGIDGTDRDGLPFQTGGDVFSSPLVTPYGSISSSGLGPLVCFGSDDGRIYAIDRRGRLPPGWPVQTGGFVSASPVPVPVERETAVAVGSWDGQLYLLDTYGRHLPGWPVDLQAAIWGSAAVADIDGDGRPEVAVATDSLFLLRSDARPLDGFPVPLGGYAVGSPAVGDIDRDGALEIVVASDRVYAFRDDGRIMEGFPVDLAAYVWASPALIDIDGDGHPEIVVGDFDGRLWAIDNRGRVVNGYPQRIGKRIASAPTAADIDGDGFLELIVATTDGRFVALPTECQDRLDRAPWPRFLAGREIYHRRSRHLTLKAVANDRNGSRAFAPNPAGPHPGQPTDGQRLRPTVSARLAGIGRPYLASEVDLATNRSDASQTDTGSPRVTGMLYYSIDGRVHPSPLLNGGGRQFALVQPLRPLKEVSFWFRLRVGDGAFGGTVDMRIPERGAYRFKVGVPGLKLDQLDRSAK